MREDLPYFESWCTPDFTMTIKPSGSLVDFNKINVTFQQGSQFLTLTGDDLAIDGDAIYVMLTQEQAGKFQGDKPAHVQVNILYNDGRRLATKWGEVWVKPNLYRKVMG